MIRSGCAIPVNWYTYEELMTSRFEFDVDKDNDYNMFTTRLISPEHNSNTEFIALSSNGIFSVSQIYLILELATFKPIYLNLNRVHLLWIAGII